MKVSNDLTDTKIKSLLKKTNFIDLRVEKEFLYCKERKLFKVVQIFKNTSNL